MALIFCIVAMLVESPSHGGIISATNIEKSNIFKEFFFLIELLWKCYSKFTELLNFRNIYVQNNMKPY